MNPSTAQATVVVDELIRGGVRDVVLCPGSRNAPLAFALEAADRAGRVRLHLRIDERTAGFLAIGLAISAGRPVPVVMTSGTAVANLGPAVLEANYARVPLVVLSANRPYEMLGTGANQTIEQLGLFDVQVRATISLGLAEEGDRNSQWRSAVCRVLAAARGTRSGNAGPVHFDIPLREPLVPDLSDTTPAPAGRPDGAAWTTTQYASLDVPVDLDLTPDTVVISGHGAAYRPELAHLPTVAEPTAPLHGPAVNPLALPALAPRQAVITGRPTLHRPVSALLANPDVDVVALTTGPRWPDVSGNVVATGTRAVVTGVPSQAWLRRCVDAAAEPRLRRHPGDDGAGAGGDDVAGHVGPARSGGEGDDVDVGIREQRGHGAVQRGAAGDDRLARRESRQGEGVHGRAVQRSRRLGHGRQVRQLGAVRGAVAGDHHGVGREIEIDRDVQAGVLRGGPGGAVGATRRGRGGVGEIGHQGFAQRDVEVHGTGVAGAGAARGREHAAHGGAPLTVAVPLLGQAEADGRPHLDVEQPELFDGLVGAGAEHLVGPVGAEDHERHASVVRLEHRGPEVGDGGARRHHHRHRATGRDREPDGQEAGRALVDPQVESDPAGTIGRFERERQRGVAGPGAQDDVTDAATDQLVDDDGGLGSGRVHRSRVTHGSRHTAGRMAPSWTCAEPSPRRPWTRPPTTSC